MPDDTTTRTTKAMRLVEAVYDKPIESVLRTLYYDEKLTVREMGDVLNVDFRTVHGWMVRLGISVGQMAQQKASELAS